jgi:hypothetical protein
MGKICWSPDCLRCASLRPVDRDRIRFGLVIGITGSFHVHGETMIYPSTGYPHGRHNRHACVCRSLGKQMRIYLRAFHKDGN